MTSHRPRRLLVVGGDAGGMTAAAQARRLVPRDELEIVAFERGRHTSYSACGIPYLVGGIVHDADDLVARTPEEHRRRGIDVHIRHEVIAIDCAARTVTVRDLDHATERDEGYDALVIATGATPLRPPIPGIDAEGIHGVQTLADGIAVRAAVDRDDPRHAVVVGGGYIGLELAEAFCLRGLDVTIVEAAPQLMTTLDPDMGALVAAALRDVGIELHLGREVDGFETDGGRVRGVRMGDTLLPADIVVLGLGVRPEGSLASAAGLVIGDTGGIVVDERMRTSAPDVFAAGDCVETLHRVSGRKVAIALGTHANKQGRVAGINVAGGDATFPGVVGTAVIEVCGREVARTGLSEREASDAGVATMSVTIEATTRAGYFPNATPITVKMVAAPTDGRILGVQIVGREDAAKRVDVAAAAIWNGMTAEQLLAVDLGYAPPVSPLWDPVLVAARKVADAVRERQSP